MYVFLVRLVCGALGGFGLWFLFFRKSSIIWAFALAALIIASAYMSESVRKRKSENENE